MPRCIRIAASTLFGLATVALCLLWMRSFWWSDWIGKFDRAKLQTSIGSSGGELICSRVDWSTEPGNHVAPHNWRYAANERTYFSKSRWISWSNNPGPGFRFAVSHLLVIPLFAALAIAPWLRWRFSLRTLLVATTLAAFVLGLSVWLAG